MIHSRAPGLWMSLALRDVSAQRVSLHVKIQCRPARCDGQFHVSVARGRAVEKEEMRYSQRSGHGGEVAKSVRASLLFRYTFVSSSYHAR